MQKIAGGGRKRKRNDKILYLYDKNIKKNFNIRHFTGRSKFKHMLKFQVQQFVNYQDVKFSSYQRKKNGANKTT